MADTTNLGITKPTVGASENVWGTTLNTGADSFDTAVAGTLSKSVAGDANVSLSDAEALNANHIYTGELTGNIAVHVPIKSRRYQVFNNTTGSFTLKVKTSSETNGTEVTQGASMVLFCDATSVIDGTSGAGQTSVTDFTVNQLTVVSLAHVQKGSSGATANALADELVVENSDHGGISILTPNDKHGYVMFGDPESNSAGQIQYDHGTPAWQYIFEGANRMYFIGSETVFNEGGQDKDFRVEAASITDIIKVDAGDDTTRIKGFIYEQQTVEASVSSGTHTIDCALGNVHDLTFLNDCSISFSNVAPDGRAQDITMIIRRTAAASIAFNPIILTAGGVTLGLADTDGRTDVLTMFTVDGGSQFYMASSFLAAATVAA